ncbi:MAG: MATE family efflux transporter [Bacteroidales bacterium]|nr:MATE family efflux transporter [Bacteroidales bacterium]
MFKIKLNKASSQVDMLNGPLTGKMLKYAMTIAISGALQQLFNSADVAVVGQFAGSNALAAVGTNGSLINLMINLFVGLSIGTNVVVATLTGEGNRDGIRKAVHTSLSIAIVSGIFLAIMGWALARPILSRLSTPPEILDDAVLYLRIYFLGMPFVMLFNFAAAILRSQGDTRRPLMALIVSGLVNVVLNLVFVAGLGMTVDGVAIATVISNGISSMILLTFLRHEVGPLKVDIRRLCIDPQMMERIGQIGIPAGLQGCVFSLSNVLIQDSINALGAATIAACTAALNFEYYTYFVANSFSQTATTFIGQNYGAGNFGRCRSIARRCIWLGALCTGILSAVFCLFASPLVSIFTTSAVVAGLAVMRMYIITSTEFLNAIVEALTGILRGFGYSLVPTMVSILGICGLRLFWLYAVYPSWNTFESLMAVYPISWIVTSVVMGIAYTEVLRTLKRKRGYNITSRREMLKRVAGAMHLHRIHIHRI